MPGGAAPGGPGAILPALCAAAVLAAALSAPGAAYGHGLGTETVGPLDAGGGQDVSVSVGVEADPDSPGTASLTVTILDGLTGRAVPDVVLDMAMSLGGQEAFRGRFAAPDGTLHADLSRPPDGGQAGITGAGDGPPWRSEPARPVDIKSPLLGGPGLHTFEIRLASVGGRDLPGAPPARADVSVVETREFVLEDSDGEAVVFRTKSYFDRVESLEYDPAAGTARLVMPFDWSHGTLSHVPVVHVEVHFPKGLAEFTSPSYAGSANDVGLFRSSVTVDDYTEEEERIVHFVLLGDHLRFVRSRADAGPEPPDAMVLDLAMSSENRFPMTAYTPGEELRVDLTWEPPEVAPGQQASFIFTIRDGATGDPLRRSSYDFVILQGGREVHRASGEAAVGGSFERFTFSEEQTGPTAIRFENIRGTGASTEFGLVVVPEFGVALLVLAAAAAAAAVLAPAAMRPGLRAPAFRAA